MWVGLVLIVLSLATAMIEAIVNPEFIRQEPPVGFYLLFLIGAWIYWLWCVHRYHDIMLHVSGYRHPISPGQAVARHFIPFYNLYRVFKWPSQIAMLVNWRAQANVMQGWIAGLLVLGAVILGRVIDGSVGLVLLFVCGIYISRQIRKAFAAPPVPPSAMAPPAIHSGTVVGGSNFIALSHMYDMSYLKLELCFPCDLIPMWSAASTHWPG
jgi:hypothetical protein